MSYALARRPTLRSLNSSLCSATPPRRPSQAMAMAWFRRSASVSCSPCSPYTMDRSASRFRSLRADRMMPGNSPSKRASTAPMAMDRYDSSGVVTDVDSLIRRIANPRVAVSQPHIDVNKCESFGVRS